MFTHVRSAIDTLRDIDPAFDGFGASRHKYQLRPPLTEAEVARIEAENGFHLPADYRAFITTVGNGGAGPGYGLYTLQDAYSQIQRFWSCDVVRRPDDVPAWDEERGADPAKPFLLHPSRRPETTPAQTPLPHSHDGCIVLSYDGCAYFTIMVVTGAGAGEVWDAGGDGYPIRPVATTFADWYLDWLESSLRGALLTAARRALRSGAAPPPHLDRFAHIFEPTARAHHRNMATILTDLALIRLCQGQRGAAESLFDAVEAQGGAELYDDQLSGDSSALQRELTQHGLDWVLHARPRGVEATTLLGSYLYPEALQAAVGDRPAQQLAQHRHELVRSALAANPTLDQPTRALLLQDARRSVRQALASADITTGAELMQLLEPTLQRLPRDPEEQWVLEALARHPAAPKALRHQLHALVRAPNDTGELAQVLLRALACNPSIEASELQELAADPAPWVRHALVLNPATPVDWLATFARDPHAFVRATVAAQHRTPRETLITLSQDAERSVRAAVAFNHAAPAKALRILAARLPSDARIDHALAMNPASPADVKACFVPTRLRLEKPRWPPDAPAYVVVTSNERWHAREHPSSPQTRALHERAHLHPWLTPEMRAHMLADYVPTKPEEAEAADIPVARLIALAEDPKQRAYVTAHPAMPLAHAVKALEDSKWQNAWRERIVANRSDLPAELLIRLARNPNEERSVREAIARNPAAPIELIRHLASDDDVHLRASCALNPSAPDDVIAQLATDPEPRVRSAAERRQRREQLRRSLVD